MLGEEDESDWSAAERLQDLYSCHVCLNHIAQVYVKGIMGGRREDLFDHTDLCPGLYIFCESPHLQVY